MDHPLNVAGIALGLLSALACGSHPQGGANCASSDLDCILSNLTVQQGGAAVPLQTIEASRLSPPGAPAAPPFLWAVGGSSPIAGWNGTGWIGYPNPAASVGLRAVWAFAANDAWAAGDSDTILHWNGTAWSVVTLPAGSGVDAADTIVGLWGDSSSDLWAVTRTGKSTHFTGTWSPFVAFATSPAVLMAVWGFGANDVWAVGSPNANGGGVAFHYNGTAWTQSAIWSAAPDNSVPNAVWGASSHEVWVAASSGSSNSEAIYQWNGSGWAKDAASSPIAGGPYGQLSLAGTGPDDVWESGYNIAGGILAHNDGTGWTVQPSFGGLLQGGALWAAARNDVWMVGSDFRRWDGTAWMKVAGPAGTYTALRGATPGSAGGTAPPSITNQPPPLTFTGTSSVNETLAWSDPSGCQPSFCFSVCNAALKCSTSARCSRSVHDGLLAGSTILTLGYTAVPADGAANLSLDVVPLSSANCQDPIALLVSGSPGALIGAPVTISETLKAGGSDGGSGGGSGGAYQWANWSCGSSAQCASAMGGSTGSAGPMCTLNDCNAWGQKYIASGYQCAVTAIYTKTTGTPANGVCYQSGVDFPP